MGLMGQAWMATEGHRTTSQARHAPQNRQPVSHIVIFRAGRDQRRINLLGHTCLLRGRIELIELAVGEKHIGANSGEQDSE